MSIPNASPLTRLWKRELQHYPGTGTRMVCLSIVVLTTVLFYYQYYVINSVSDNLLQTTGMSFMYFVMVNVVSSRWWQVRSPRWRPASPTATDERILSPWDCSAVRWSACSG